MTIERERTVALIEVVNESLFSLLLGVSGTD